MAAPEEGADEPQTQATGFLRLIMVTALPRPRAKKKKRTWVSFESGRLKRKRWC